MKQFNKMIVLSVIALGLTLAGCGGGGNEGAESEGGDGGPLGKLKEAAKGLEDMANEMEQMEQKEPQPPVHFSKLIEYLPTTVAGLEMEEPEGETSQMGEWTYSTASAKYKGEDNNNWAEVTIHDYAYINMLYMPYKMLLKMGMKKESTSGYERSTEILGFPGYEEWKKKQERSKVTALVGERFIVIVTTKGVAEGLARETIEGMPLVELSEETGDQAADAGDSAGSEDMAN
ncbi:MAG: hypothetical protein CL946_09920 [Ectothiorhodospiraceae bacterium]|nr:hypothetical protein [Ectothiorhodospiraceae bacterium]